MFKFKFTQKLSRTFLKKKFTILAIAPKGHAELSAILQQWNQLAGRIKGLSSLLQTADSSCHRPWETPSYCHAQNRFSTAAHVATVNLVIMEYVNQKYILIIKVKNRGKLSS